MPILTRFPDYLLTGYGEDYRIASGTGGVVPVAGLPARFGAILRAPDVAFVDVRSARNNCFQVRVVP